MYANNVSNLDQILSSLQCYPQSSRVRGDVYNLLGQIPSLQPNCGTFAHNDGTTSTLLNLEGTIPIFYRSNQYNIPVEFWVVETYPLAPPVCFVRPTADMMVKPGHPHVTSDGYVKIPYTSDWRPDFTLLELVAHMCSIFGNMPPVFRRPANSRPAPARANGSSGTGNYFQQGSYAQSHPPQPSPYYSSQFTRAQDLSASGGPREAESLFGSSQQSVGAASSVSAASGRVSGELRPEERAAALKADITERGLQSLRFLRDDVSRAQGVVETQDKEVSAWLEENEGKDTVDPDTILVEVDALSKQMIKTLAEHYSIEDALYYMDRALSNDEIELAVFLKELQLRTKFECSGWLVARNSM
ncbi:Vacuolar sorting protein/ubiquitin receptor VPS23 [Phytophthora cinnamomi]|uniref:Vacuolar sorting protein/ubiquitin receptor VPS23 n=1 Tax=Phytophthora cinnamomi TaxID=4785 RepID=UPI00355A20B9|nr:Vacuolar sorting protein/ubiquitin receptor VPS23 [Phytophthora cinnamomi]